MRSSPRRDRPDSAAVGTVERGKSDPPDVRDHFRIASNTRTMTAALIMLLAQDGKLRLSDPVSKYVADVPNGANITLAELLRMRSGLYNYTQAPELAAALDADPGKAYTPRDVQDIAFRRRPDGRTTAQAMLPTLLNQIYTGLDLPTV